MDNTIAFGRRQKSHKKNAAKAAERIKINERHGLSTGEAAESRIKYGANSITEQQRHGLIFQFVRNLGDPIIRVLIAGLIINIIFTYRNVNWIEACGIALTVFIATLVSTVSEFSSGAAYDRLFRSAAEHIHTVIRDGKAVRLPVSEIVRFDIIELSSGEIIPCDGILLSGEVTCDQSALTGESKPAEKIGTQCTFLTEDLIDASSDPSSPSFLCRGSGIISGEGIMIATAVGDKTLYGGIAVELQDERGPSPLKERLTALAKTISKIGYIGAALAAVAYLISSLILAGDGGADALSRLSDTKLVASEILHALTLAVSLIIVVVPEGLPMMITVVLSANMKKMMRHGVLVRRLVGIETAGSLSILFTDKTGTVTTGQMRVTEVITSDEKFNSKGDIDKAPFLRQQVALGSEFCSGRNGGNLTDRAISALSSRSFAAEFESVGRIPFDSKRKFAAALIRERSTGRLMTLVRGAPEVIFAGCTSARRSDGQSASFSSRTPSGSPAFLREIAQAYGDGDCFDALRRGEIPHTLVYVCSYLISDEVREAVPRAAADCASAGIQVVMLTGDGDRTAAAVAEEAGILNGKYRVFDPSTDSGTGQLVLRAEDLHRMSDEDLTSLLPRIGVISRATPQDKTRLVRIAINAGNVVGMTGDGVNDAPALKAADVGFAMGSGTDAAREAGDIIISDNNFVSITRAILYGRTIFGSIRKFILFQLTMNVCAVGVSLIAPFFGIESPITITQMLWINIIMDTLGSLAFAGEAPLPEYMKRPPTARSEKILTREMCIRIIFGGLYTLALSLYYLISDSMHRCFDGDELYYLTVFFALFVFCGIANSFCARTERMKITSGLSGNRPFILIMLLVASVQLIMIYFGGNIFRTVPLEPRALFGAALLSLTVFPADFFCKLFISVRRRRISRKQKI